MPLWTNGSAYVVATGWGVSRSEGKKSESSRYPNEGLKRDQEPPSVLAFATLDAEGRTALIRRDAEPSAIWTAGAGFDPIDAPDLYGAVSLEPGAMLVAVEHEDRIVLRRAKLDGKQLSFSATIDLPAAQKVKWPSGLWEKGDEIWAEEDELGRVQMVSNRCGIAVASPLSGIAALIDRTTLAPKLSVRVPIDDEDFGFYALPVPQGILLTLVIAGGNTEYLLLSDKGEVVAHKHKLGKELATGATNGGLLWADDKVVVSQNLNSAAMYFLGLPGLAPKQLGKEEAMMIESTSTETGSHHLLAIGAAGAKSSAWKLLQYDPNAKKLKGEELAMPDFKPPPPPVQKPEKRKRSEGSPVLAMKPDQGTPWRAAANESTALKFQVSNRGGPLAGMYVELGGNAVSDALIAGEDAVLGGVKGRFEKKGSAFRAEMSDAKLEAHFADATRGDPAPAIELVIKLKAQKAGNALMTVRVGPIGATGTMGSAMEGRSFIVT
jgi:hypothetical protein